MSRRGARMLAVAAIALAAVGCGVTPENVPEPLPPSAPVVLPPSVTQEPASEPTSTVPAPDRAVPSSTTPAP